MYVYPALHHRARAEPCLGRPHRAISLPAPPRLHRPATPTRTREADPTVRRWGAGGGHGAHGDDGAVGASGHQQVARGEPPARVGEVGAGPAALLADPVARVAAGAAERPLAGLAGICLYPNWGPTTIQLGSDIGSLAGEPIRTYWSTSR